MAASIPEFPPPITATFLPLNSGPSQWVQYATPLFLNSISPGIPKSFHLAPVAIITDLASSFAPLSSSTSIRRRSSLEFSLSFRSP